MHASMRCRVSDSLNLSSDMQRVDACSAGSGPARTDCPTSSVCTSFTGVARDQGEGLKLKYYSRMIESEIAVQAFRDKHISNYT